MKKMLYELCAPSNIAESHIRKISATDLEIREDGTLVFYDGEPMPYIKESYVKWEWVKQIDEQTN